MATAFNQDRYSVTEERKIVIENDNARIVLKNGHPESIALVSLRKDSPMAGFIGFSSLSEFKDFLRNCQNALEGAEFELKVPK